MLDSCVARSSHTVTQIVQKQSSSKCEDECLSRCETMSNFLIQGLTCSEVHMDFLCAFPTKFA